MEPHRGSTILVLGILSIVHCAICGPIAWVMANRDLLKMSAGTMDPEGLSQTNAGKICGIIGTVFLILGAVLTVIYVIFIVLAIGIGVSQSGPPQ